MDVNMKDLKKSWKIKKKEIYWTCNSFHTKNVNQNAITMKIA